MFKKITCFRPSTSNLIKNTRDFYLSATLQSLRVRSTQCNYNGTLGSTSTTISMLIALGRKRVLSSFTQTNLGIFQIINYSTRKMFTFHLILFLIRWVKIHLHRQSFIAKSFVTKASLKYLPWLLASCNHDHLVIDSWWVYNDLGHCIYVGFAVG